MADRTDVAMLVGSLRPEGYSNKLARALIELAPEQLAPHIVPIGELPLYWEAHEQALPAAYVGFRHAMRAAKAVLFVTPEYNRGIPGGLKNAIDVGSRPYGQSVYAGKPAAVISQSPGALGGFGANHAVRQSLVFLDMPAMQMPEAYISHSNELFDDTGKLQQEGTRSFLTGLMRAFAGWIDRLGAA